MKLVYKRIGSLIVFLLSWFCVFSQPATSYTIKQGTNLSLASYTSANDCISGSCPFCTSTGGRYNQKGFSVQGFQYWPPLPPSGDPFGSVSVSVTPGSPGTSQVLSYITRPVDLYMGSSGTCAASAYSYSKLYDITIYTVADLSATKTLPASICQSSASINLYSYVNKTSSVSFLDGSTMISSTLNPSQLSVGSHSIKATYTFANGTTTVNLGTVQVYQDVAIQQQPIPTNACPGQSAAFIVTAVGSALVYQWEESTNNGGTWLALNNAGVYSGVNSGQLTISNTTGKNGYLYRVKLTGNCNTLYSSSESVTEYGPVAITSSPASQQVCPDAAVQFQVSGLARSGTLSYQWQILSNGVWTDLANGGGISGVLTSVLTYTAGSGTQVRCRVRDGCGTVNQMYSGVANYSLLQGPTLISQPVNQTTCVNASASFSVAATPSSGSLSYQWQVSQNGGTSWVNVSNGSNTLGTFTGSTTAQLHVTVVTNIANQTRFRCFVRDACGDKTEKFSSAAVLTVNDAPTVTINPENVSVCPGTAASFTATGIGFGGVSYQWQVSSNGGSTYTDLQNGGGYTGATTSNLTLADVSTAKNGYWYRVIVTAVCSPAVSSSGAKLTVNPFPDPPIATSPSRCGSGAIGATASSTVSNPVFKWYNNPQDISPVATGATYSIANLSSNLTYYVTVSAFGCESGKRTVTFSSYPVKDNYIGGTLSLCAGQGLYNLEGDISAADAVGSNFTYTANGTNYSTKKFDPSIGAGTYQVNYDPPANAKAVPYCYLPTERTVNVLSNTSDAGIAFDDEIVHGNTINLCVGDSPINLALLPSVSGGLWTSENGGSLSYNGEAVIFTPDAQSYTQSAPHQFRYTVQVNGCSASKLLNVYVKNNPDTPIVSGIPSTVCPGKTLNLSSSVAAAGSYSFEWYMTGESEPFFRGSSLYYAVSRSETFQVRSINTFNCPSEATLVKIVTPFNSGSISASRNLVSIGESVNFSTDALEDGNTFDWNFGDGAASSERNPTHFYYASGRFTVRLNIVSTLGCSQDLTYENLIVNGDSVSIITVTEPIDWLPLQVYPNPAFFTLAVESSRGVNAYYVIDQSGRVVIEGEAHGEKSFAFYLGQLSSGTYTLCLSDGGTRMRRITIIKE